MVTKIEYCAASDAETYAPEGFFELFKQRRRWIPSTLGNVLTIIIKGKAVTSKNQYINWLYILYQVVLFVTSVLTPGTIFLLILGSIITAFPDIDPLVALIINVIPVSLFTVVCFVFSEETQLYVAGFLSNVYALLMLIVSVGLLQNAIEAGLCSVTSVFMIYVVSLFFLAAVCHPKIFDIRWGLAVYYFLLIWFCAPLKLNSFDNICTREFRNLFFGVVYFLAIPSTSMLMVIYALVNLHVVSWGTRESSNSVKTTKRTNVFRKFCNFICCKENKIQTDIEQGTGEKKGNKKYEINFDKKMIYQKCTDKSITVIWNFPKENVSGYSLMVNKEMSGKPALKKPKILTGDRTRTKIKGLKPNTSYVVSLTATFYSEKDFDVVERLVIKTREEKKWFESEEFLKKMDVVEDDDKADAKAKAEENEIKYLKELRKCYLLTSVKAGQDEQRHVETELLSLRNKVCVTFFVINTVFVAIIYILTHISAYQGTLSVALWCQSNGVVPQTRLEPISITFILMFGVLLGIQFLSMLGHRILTMIHVLASAKNEENINKQIGKNNSNLKE